MYVICYYKFIFKIHIHLESFDRTSQVRFIKITSAFIKIRFHNPLSTDSFTRSLLHFCRLELAFSLVRVTRAARTGAVIEIPR